MATSTVNRAHLHLLSSCHRQSHSSAVHGRGDNSQHFHSHPYPATWAVPKPCPSFPLQDTVLQASSLLCPSRLHSIQLCLKAETPPPPGHSYPREQGYSLHPSPTTLCKHPTQPSLHTAYTAPRGSASRHLPTASPAGHRPDRSHCPSSAASSTWQKGHRQSQEPTDGSKQFSKMKHLLKAWVTVRKLGWVLCLHFRKPAGTLTTCNNHFQKGAQTNSQFAATICPLLSLIYN